MNKRYLTAIMGAVFFSLTAGSAGIFAGNSMFDNNNGYGVSGCGLGAVVITPRDQVSQVVSATVNNIVSWNQTFGITTGTSNCKANAGAFRNREQEIFAAVNMSSLEQEMAAGKGENLSAFANLLGCPTQEMVSFGNMTRKEFKNLSNYTESPEVFVKMIKTSISKDKSLSSSCMI